MENKNEIKKVLYKTKPMAEFVRKEGNMNIYIAEANGEKIYFSIPDAEMLNEDGKKIINDKVEGQLLIRWIR